MLISQKFIDLYIKDEPNYQKNSVLGVSHIGQSSPNIVSICEGRVKNRVELTRNAPIIDLSPFWENWCPKKPKQHNFIIS